MDAVVVAPLTWMLQQPVLHEKGNVVVVQIEVLLMCSVNVAPQHLPLVMHWLLALSLQLANLWYVLH